MALTNTALEGLLFAGSVFILTPPFLLKMVTVLFSDPKVWRVFKFWVCWDISVWRDLLLLSKYIDFFPLTWKPFLLL